MTSHHALILLGSVNTASEGLRPNVFARREEHRPGRVPSSTLPSGSSRHTGVPVTRLRGKGAVATRGRTAVAFFARVVEIHVRQIVKAFARHCILPVCAPCPECRCKRRLTQEFCRHCGSPFTAPRPDGTEIISDLAGERFLFWAPGIGADCEVLEVAA